MENFSNPVFLLVIIITVIINTQPVSSDNCEYKTPYLINLNLPIEEVEALIKQYFEPLEHAILSAKANASILAAIRSAQGLSGPALAINIGNIMTRAYCNRPLFRIDPEIRIRPGSSASAPRLMAPLCGTEIQQLACSLLAYHTDGRVFLSPFDLDELVSSDTRGSTPWHRNSPLVTIVRLCAGLKAMTKYEATETCVGPIILEKLKALINGYSNFPSINAGGQQSEQNASSTEAVAVSYGNRYLTIKAILKNYGYSSQGTALDHVTGNGVDILCGESAGVDSGAEKNCTTIRQLCLASSSTNVVTPAENTGCGAIRSPLTSVHCAFFNRPVINLANMSAVQVEEAIRQHYEPFDKKAQATITDVVSTTVKAAVSQNMTVTEAINIVKAQIVPKLFSIIMDAYENGIVFNVTTIPRRSYAVQFKRIGFRLAPGNGAIDEMLSRNTRQANDQGLECPAASVDMAKKLLELYSVGGKIVFLPYIFTKYNLSAIFETVSTAMSAVSATQEPVTYPTLLGGNTDTYVKRYVNAKAALRWQINAAAKARTTTESSTTTSTDATTTTTTATQPPQTTEKAPDNSSPETRTPSGALENIVRMAFGNKAFNSDGNNTCISYEALYGIYKLANDFYDKYQQPIYIAALSGTDYHQSTAEAQTHFDGVAIDSLCGLVYRRNNAVAASPTGDEATLYCSELTSGCFQTSMFARAELGAVSGCLSDSILQLYGIVHCRSRQ